MPIAPDMRHLYPPDWPEIARRCKERAKWRCQHCRMRSGQRYYWCQRDGERVRIRLRKRENPPGKAPLRVVQLGAAHLNHDPADCSDQNLACLCRYCHLMHDRDYHRQRRRENLWREILTRPLMRLTMEVA